jgi:hypothetical protein
VDGVRMDVRRDQELCRESLRVCPNGTNNIRIQG